MRRILVSILVVLLFGQLFVGIAFGHGHTPEDATGDGVKVGVIDFEFDLTTDSPIDSNVEGAQTFGDTSLDAEGAHGTGVAEAVVQEAPEVDLYLAAAPKVELEDSSSVYDDATNWMIDQDVDVVVISLGYFGQPNDGSGSISQMTNEMNEEGISVVVSAGNQAESHWQGETEVDEDDYIIWDGESDTENTIEGVGGASLYFSRYDHSQSSGIYELQQNGNTWEVNLEANDFEKFEDLELNEPFEVQVDSLSDPGEHIQLHVVGGDLKYSIANGSVTSPAVAEQTISVGAHNNESEIRPYSSRGILPDGRIGVDIVAEDGIELESRDNNQGTSFSAPRVGGTIAAMKSIDPDLTSEDAQFIIEQTADSGPEGEEVFGSGILDHDSSVTYGEVDIESLETDNENITIVASNTKPLRGYHEVNIQILNESVQNEVIMVERFTANKNIPLTYTGNVYGNITYQINGEEGNVFYDSPSSSISTQDDITYTIRSLNQSAANTPGEQYVNFHVNKTYQGDSTVSIGQLDPGREYEVYEDGKLIKNDQPGLGSTITTNVSEGSEYTIVTGSKTFGLTGPSSVDTLILSFATAILALGFGGLYLGKRRDDEFYS